MIASLYPMGESKTDIESGFIEGNHVAVKMDDNHFICGKSRIRMYDRHGIRRTYDRVDEAI
jgi:hypothetical protein